MVYLSGPTTFLSLASNILVFGLLSLNVILILLLLFLVVRNLVKLLFERRKGIFGAKLRTKFVVAFVGFSVVPAGMLFLAAISYIGKSTDLWLNARIEQSLKASESLIETFRQEKGAAALAVARRVAGFLEGKRLADTRTAKEVKALLERERKTFQLDFLVFYTLEYDPVAGAFSAGIPSEGWRYASKGTLKAFVRPGEEGYRIRRLDVGEVIEGFVPVYSSHDPKDLEGVLSAGYLLPAALGKNLEAVSQTYRQYRELRNRERPIEWNYYILLTIVLLMVIFLSSWFGFYLSKQITIPLQQLAQKTQEVARGRLDFEVEETSKDEIGTLVDSFNRMTRQLRKSQAALEASHRELRKATWDSERRRRYMEIILRNIGAGVISLDEKDRITTVNRAAESMLGIRTEKVLDRPFWEVIQEEHRGLVESLVEEWERGGRETMEREVHLSIDGRPLSLMVTVNSLRDEEGRYRGLVAVFDDITEIQKAQRMLAWKEVARRIAHEIKNPLTPIKLSAQRIRRRYLPMLADGDGVLDECTSTIIEQVDHLMAMVNEFHSFARMPLARPAPLDLNSLVEETLAFYRGSHPHVTFQFDPEEDLPVIALDRDQFRQVLVNLIENALAVLPKEEGLIQVKTAYNRKLKVVRLEVADNGPGIPPEAKGRVFEPDFSTKRTGSGLGLAIVRSIVTDHRGYIRILDQVPQGTRFVIELPIGF